MMNLDTHGKRNEFIAQIDSESTSLLLPQLTRRSDHLFFGKWQMAKAMLHNLRIKRNKIYDYDDVEIVQLYWKAESRIRVL